MYRISRISLSTEARVKLAKTVKIDSSWNLIKTVKQPGDCLPKRETLNFCSERVVAFLLTCLLFPSPQLIGGCRNSSLRFWCVLLEEERVTEPLFSKNCGGTF